MMQRRDTSEENVHFSSELLQVGGAVNGKQRIYAVCVYNATQWKLMNGPF